MIITIHLQADIDFFVIQTLQIIVILILEPLF